MSIPLLICYNSKIYYDNLSGVWIKFVGNGKGPLNLYLVIINKFYNNIFIKGIMKVIL